MYTNEIIFNTNITTTKNKEIYEKTIKDHYKARMDVANKIRKKYDMEYKNEYQLRYEDIEVMIYQLEHEKLMLETKYENELKAK